MSFRIIRGRNRERIFFLFFDYTLQVMLPSKFYGAIKQIKTDEFQIHRFNLLSLSIFNRLICIVFLYKLQD